MHQDVKPEINIKLIYTHTHTFMSAHLRSTKL